MGIAKSRRGSPVTTARAQERRKDVASVRRRVSGAIDVARAGATMLIVRAPGTMHTTQAGAHRVTSVLQTLPDSTLRWLAASSVGLGAGLSLAGAPRLVRAAGMAPALILGAAIVLRPIQPDVPAAGADHPRCG